MHLDVISARRDYTVMRTTLNIDPDVLAAVRSLAAQRRQTLGKTISELARRALEPAGRSKRRNGVPLFQVKSGSPPVTMDLVNALRDGEEPA